MSTRIGTDMDRERRRGRKRRRRRRKEKEGERTQAIPQRGRGLVLLCIGAMGEKLWKLRGGRGGADKGE
jgi:hypothetical protein